MWNYSAFGLTESSAFGLTESSAFGLMELEYRIAGRRRCPFILSGIWLGAIHGIVGMSLDLTV